jgi:hypothetical protein
MLIELCACSRTSGMRNQQLPLENPLQGEHAVVESGTVKLPMSGIDTG